MKERMVVNRQIICLTLALICLQVLAVSQIAAQALSSMDSNAISQPDSNIISDVFIGNGTTGPYVLSWRNIESESETVTVSGRVLTTGQDYEINYTNGILTLKTPLEKNSIARVSYKRIIGKAQANSGISLPVNMRLFDRGHASLDVIGLYNSGDGKQNEPGLSLYGVSGGLKLGQSSDLSSTFIVSQNSSVDDKKLDMSDRSAMRFGAATTLGGLALKGSFARAGEYFASAKEYGFQQAKELTDLSATYGKPSDFVFASFSYKEQEELGGLKKGAVQTDSEQKVVLNLNSSSSMTLTRAANEKEYQDGNKSGTVLESLRLDKEFGGKTSATAMLQKSETQSGQDKDEIRTASLGLSTTAIDKVQFSSTLTKKDSEQTGEELGVNINAKAELSQRLNMDASYSSNDSEAAGLQTKTSIGMAANPLDWMRLQSSVIWKSSDQTGDETGVDLGMKASPNKRFSIDARYSSLDSDQQGQTTKTAMKVMSNPLDRVDLTADFSYLNVEAGGQRTAGIRVATQPINQMKLEGSYYGKQEDQGCDEQHRSVKLEAQPSHYLKLLAGLGEKEVDAQLQTTKEAAVEITPSSRLKMASSVKEYNDGLSTMTVRDYSGALKPTDYLEVSGAYKERENHLAERLESKSLRLALGQPKAFRLTGQYAYNPEDNKGNVQRLSSAALGLELKIGILGITGGYSENEEYLAGNMRTDKELGLNFPLFGNGKFQTGYKLSETITAAKQSTETFSIGYNHDLGSRFNLSISGEFIRVNNESLIPGEEYKATAKLGMKF